MPIVSTSITFGEIDAIVQSLAYTQVYAMLIDVQSIPHTTTGQQLLHLIPQRWHGRLQSRFSWSQLTTSSVFGDHAVHG